MNKGLGIDLIEIDRIERVLVKYGQKFLDRIFTQKEQAYCKSFHKMERHFAGRFAAKEAISKALGTGIGKNLSWEDMEVLNDEHGAPYVVLSLRAQAFFHNPKILISISHAKEYATAVAIVQKDTRIPE